MLNCYVITILLGNISTDNENACSNSNMVLQKAVENFIDGANKQLGSLKK